MVSVAGGGRICGRRHVRVNKPFVSGVAGSVAIPIGGIGGRAISRAFFAARRLRVLPNVGGRATLGNGWDVRENAARRRRADIVENPENKLAAAEMILQVPDGSDRVALALVDRDGRTVGAGVEAYSSEFIEPGSNVFMVALRQATALFDIEEDDSSGWEAFLTSEARDGLRVEATFLPRVGK